MCFGQKEYKYYEFNHPVTTCLIVIYPINLEPIVTPVTGSGSSRVICSFVENTLNTKVPQNVDDLRVIFNIVSECGL